MAAATARRGGSEHQILDGLPPVDVADDQIACPLESRVTVMRRLIEATAGSEVELVDGVN